MVTRGSRREELGVSLADRADPLAAVPQSTRTSRSYVDAGLGVGRSTVSMPGRKS